MENLLENVPLMSVALYVMILQKQKAPSVAELTTAYKQYHSSALGQLTHQQ